MSNSRKHPFAIPHNLKFVRYIFLTCLLLPVNALPSQWPNQGDALTGSNEQVKNM